MKPIKALWRSQDGRETVGPCEIIGFSTHDEHPVAVVTLPYLWTEDYQNIEWVELRDLILVGVPFKWKQCGGCLRLDVTVVETGAHWSECECNGHVPEKPSHGFPLVATHVGGHVIVEKPK